MKENVLRKGKKIVAFSISAVMAITMFAGCTKKANDKDEQGRTIVSVGNWPQKEGSYLERMQARKDKFEADNPDVVIDPSSWVFDFRTFYTRAAGGQLPTVYETNYTEVSQIIGSGYSADMTDALKKYGIYDKFNKDVLDIISKDGKIYVFPYAAYCMGLAYNVELFEKAGLMNADGTPQQPKNWDEVVEFAKKIKQATGKAGFIFPTSGNNGGWIFTCLAWSFGADFMKQDDDGKWKACFNSPEATEALQWIKDLKWKHDVLPANNLIDHGEAFKLFGTGEGAMIVSAGDLGKKVSAYEMNPEHIGIMGIPAGPKKHVTLLGGSIYAISNTASAEQIDAGVRWIMTETTPEASEDYKINKDKELNIALEKGEIVSVKSMSVWNDEADAVKYEYQLRDKLANTNVNHVKLYNDFVADLGECELRAEEPVCAQELYGILDGCIQEVLTNENSDPAAVLEKANGDFQANYLDNLEY